MLAERASLPAKRIGMSKGPAYLFNLFRRVLVRYDCLHEMLSRFRESSAGSCIVIVGFLGNCQAELLHRAFRRIAPPGVESFYHFHDLTPEEASAARADLARCDVLLMQDIRNVDDYPLHEAIDARTKVIRFPFLSFAAPWPWDDFNGFRDASARAQDDVSLHTVTYYDGALGRLRKRVADPVARREAYRGLDLPGLVAPTRVLDFEMRRLEGLDTKFGIAIGRAILKGFRREQLFYTVNRPAGPLLAQLLAFLLDALALPRSSAALPELDELGAIQVPIHPRVAQELGLVWATADRLYPHKGRLLDWDGYVSDYIARYS